MTKDDTNPKRVAAIAMLKAGTASLSEVATLAGVSPQAASRWIQTESAGKRKLAFDWQAKRTKYLARTWRKQLAKSSTKSPG